MKLSQIKVNFYANYVNVNVNAAYFVLNVFAEFENIYLRPQSIRKTAFCGIENWLMYFKSHSKTPSKLQEGNKNLF